MGGGRSRRGGLGHDPGAELQNIFLQILLDTAMMASSAQSAPPVGEAELGLGRSDGESAARTGRRPADAGSGRMRGYDTRPHDARPHDTPPHGLSRTAHGRTARSTRLHGTRPQACTAPRAASFGAPARRTGTCPTDETPPDWSLGASVRGVGMTSHIAHCRGPGLGGRPMVSSRRHCLQVIKIRRSRSYANATHSRRETFASASMPPRVQTKCQNRLTPAVRVRPSCPRGI